MNPNDTLVPFGKYKGQSINKLIEDQKYLEWCKQTNVLDKYPIVYNIIYCLNTNQSNVDAPTPEHNRMQNMFLEKDIQCNLVKQYFRVPNKITSIKKFAETHDLVIEKFDHTKEIDLTQFITSVKFEEKFGWDVVINVDYLCYDSKIEHFTDRNKFEEKRQIIIDHCKGYSYISESHLNYDLTYYFSIFHAQSICCEIKPILGDDYPCVLRKLKQQIENTSHYIVRSRSQIPKAKDNPFLEFATYLLIIKDYTSSTATIDQLKTIFKEHKIHVMMLDEICQHVMCTKGQYESIETLKERISSLEIENKMLRTLLDQNSLNGSPL